MTLIFVSITGPGTTDDLINGGREAVARAGYQVGDFELEQELDGGVVGNLQVEDRLADLLHADGYFEFTWGEIEIGAEAP